ncbi:putative signal transducing protein [Tamlana crocina]|uniref:DUF2007 domain-containing protein n=1 Tax=Tamlana crocina TaxID=393006 RepID=A0ABX1DDY6_9FLAO|nr:DUF2007 domain-containing protein [Tamlana crocina]NJX15577.1 DUF2007 domain-containing protein [Tamlana crocina]
MSNYIKIFSGSFIEVQRIFSELEKINICAIIKDESESARLAGFGTFGQGFQEIHVHKDELDRALKAIKTLSTELQE